MAITEGQSSWTADRLQRLAALYKERNEDYGDNYKRWGKLMMALFPNGLTLRTEDDWNRMGVYTQAFSKFTRYAAQWGKGGHPDSCDDAAVYMTMLNELDHEIDAAHEAQRVIDQGG